jgi:hypothetical protein
VALLRAIRDLIYKQIRPIAAQISWRGKLLMSVHLVNPSDNSFGTAVITPRWLFVLAAATPQAAGDPILVDESLEQIVPESISDVVSSTVVFFGLKFAIKPPDKEHPYGHGKAEPVAAVMVSLALIVAAILIGIESIQRIQELHPLPKPYTLWVLLAVVGIKVLLSRYVTGVGESLESTAVRSDAWHHLSDAITSGFAFIGISIALWTRNPAADDWAALCASPIIIIQRM